ncbi:S41 family peptidase [Robertkochia solimangrovi]|uniref:S41 family peptidase n=1 Tax=Robertkochia solimangrovi TaxID=2213046 RepID=UPI00117F810E|nr:S41 family peptidase [Robertkochia solimangrovi]TRZ42599.1 protease [Robertkochia solimangrovi]
MKPTLCKSKVIVQAISIHDQRPFFLAVLFSLLSCLMYGQNFEGYYRFPTVNGATVVFAAEGDLWKVPLTGGAAVRLTTHAESESAPVFSPDGKSVVFTASYEGPSELYLMSLSGGVPERLTYENAGAVADSWASAEELIYHTTAYATLPDFQLVKLNVKTHTEERIPLSQASEADIDTRSKTLFFVSPMDHRNVTKRYMGGTARQIWKFVPGAADALKLTTDYNGESFNPMFYNDRIYFLSDRDGIMNIWSMNTEGNDLKQHTKHEVFDVRSADLHNANIVYQTGADLWHLDLASGSDKKIEIWLPSDLDQLREKWVDNPSRYISSAKTDAKGEKVVITARGRIFIAPVKSGRFITFAPKKDIRYRDAFFSADGKSIYALSDESGEFEYVKLDALGLQDSKPITTDGHVLRFGGVNSPDGKWIAYNDLENNMFILDVNTGKSKVISTNQQGIAGYSWSPDSKWIAFSQEADNTMYQVMIYSLESGKTTAVTTDRANSISAEWSPDGKFLYLLSDRNFQSLVGAPWGPRQPEPYFDQTDKIYLIPLKKEYRSPFKAPDELLTSTDTQETPKSKSSKKDSKEADSGVTVAIDFDGIKERLMEVPVSSGNYRSLKVTENGLFVLASETGLNAKTHLKAIPVKDEDAKLKTILEDVNGLDLSADGKKLLIRKGRNFYVTNAGTSPISGLNDNALDLSSWKFAISPREDWEQMFMDAWRMERDYFYDKNMHGVNWKAMYDRYYPLLKRVTTREELSDLIGRYVGELAALHTSVRGGDQREDEKDISVASLGARLLRDEKKGGYVIDHIYKADPDYPDEKSPLDDPYLNISEGDVITAINGTSVLSVNHIGALLRDQAGKQVRVSLKNNSGNIDKIVEPIQNDYNLRYTEWEYTRRLKVEEDSKNQIGYVHLRAMGSGDLSQWYREFYPVFDRAGLIIDVRHNRGGNIESFILEKLLRKAWMYWKQRSGKPYWNMQYAFRGHIVILVDELTASDGEAFAEGFKRLGLGKSIGVRTWGGEIWLSGVNTLTDYGVARAPMMGVYGEESEWLIEGHGFVPDIEVVNMPHATFNGEDAQLDMAIKVLQEEIAKDPREIPAVPAYPDKSFKNKK